MAHRWGGAREGAGRSPDAYRADERPPRTDPNDWRLAPLSGCGSFVISTEYRIREHEDRVLAMLMYGSGKYGLTDDELREHFETWAKDRRPHQMRETWDETTYAHQRFVVGLSAEDAHAAMEAADAAEEEAAMLTTLVECNIRDPREPFLAGLSPEQREDLLARARPLQAPLDCVDCESATALPTGYRCAESVSARGRSSRALIAGASLKRHGARQEFSRGRRQRRGSGGAVSGRIPSMTSSHVPRNLVSSGPA